MMQKLIDTLHTEQCNLVILHDGKISRYNGHGVRRLYNIATDEPELLYDAKVAAKAVGQSAARMLRDGKVAEVWADYMSDQAHSTLADAGITVNCGKQVDHVTFLDIWRKLGEADASER